METIIMKSQIIQAQAIFQDIGIIRCIHTSGPKHAMHFCSQEMPIPPLETTIYDDSMDSDLPPLQFPDDDFWNVFVTVANSTLEIWLRIIGSQYSVSKYKKVLVHTKNQSTDRYFSNYIHIDIIDYRHCGVYSNLSTQ